MAVRENNGWIKAFRSFNKKAMGLLYRLAASLLGPFYGLKLLRDLLEAIESTYGRFLTYHARPWASSGVKTRGDAVRRGPRTALVIQGPVVADRRFTRDSVLIYRRNFPSADIILSTWDNTPSGLLEECRDAGAEVLLNRVPASRGIRNINLQIASSANGIARARENGAEYVIKTRTDQRFYAPDVLEFLYHLTEVFPVGQAFRRQRKRIVACALDTFKYRLYGLSDMLQFGHIDDMSLYWSAKPDTREFRPEDEKKHTTTLRQYSLWRVCEVYLATEFLRELGRELCWTLADSWAAYADHFCVADSDQLDLFWGKYDRREHMWLRYDLEDNLMQELAFRDWLNLYCNREDREVPEEILDRPLR